MMTDSGTQPKSSLSPSADMASFPSHVLIVVRLSVYHSFSLFTLSPQGHGLQFGRLETYDDPSSEYAPGPLLDRIDVGARGPRPVGLWLRRLGMGRMGRRDAGE